MRGLSVVANAILLLPRALRLFLSAAWMGMIWYLSSQADLLPQGTDSLFWVVLANLGHAPLFGLLAMWLGLSFLPRQPRGAPLAKRIAALSATSLALTWLLTVGFGVLDEWHQSQVPGRDATLADVLVDALGAAMVLWIAAYMARDGALEAGLRKRLLLGISACVGVTLGLSLC